MKFTESAQHHYRRSACGVTLPHPQRSDIFYPKSELMKTAQSRTPFSFPTPDFRISPFMIPFDAELIVARPAPYFLFS